MKDPYEVLEVPRDADPVTIKKRYRKKATNCHPDKHKGCAKKEEEFKELQRAYDILKDPERKLLYDRTGRTDDAPVSDIDTEARGAVTAVFMSSMEFVERNMDPVKRSTSIITSQLTDFRKKLGEEKKSAQKAKADLSRLEHKGDDADFLRAAMEANVSRLEGNVAGFERAIKVGERALDLLAAYSFQMPAPKQPDRPQYVADAFPVWLDAPAHTGRDFML